MSQQNTRAGNIVGICFMIFWCSIAFGMGITAWSWGAPPFFSLVAFGMGGFGIVICLTTFRRRSLTYPQQRSTQHDYMTYTGDYQSPHSQPVERKSYEAPSYCPSCGASISTDEVDWVAPLKAVCPYCEAVIDAVERDS
ncbi:MAG: hypothetical protein ACFFFK_08915 [Candidatus Thorarchaeota archaeon]